MKLKNRNKSIIIAITAVILILLSGFILMIWNNHNDYKRTIAVNWGIRIPGTSEEVFEKESPAGFHGDNDRYHIFKINQDQQTTDFITSMNTGKNLQLQEYVPVSYTHLDVYKRQT